MKRRLSFVIIMVMVIVMIAGCGKATSAQKPAETTSSQKPAETTSSQKPAETTDADDAAETTSSQKPAETTNADDAAETTSSQKPAETTDANDAAETIIKDGFFKAIVSGEEVFSVELPSGEWQAIAFVTDIDCGLAYNKDNRKIYRIDSFSITEVAEVSDFLVSGEILYFVSPEKEGYINQWAFAPQNIKVCDNAISVSADPPGFILGDGSIMALDF